MWLDSKAVNCPQKWGNFTHALRPLAEIERRQDVPQSS